MVSARIITDKFSGRSKGFGFVEMSSDQEAERATTALNGTDFEGGNIVVSEARPQQQRMPRPGWAEEAGRRAAIATKSALPIFPSFFFIQDPKPEFLCLLEFGAGIGRNDNVAGVPAHVEAMRPPSASIRRCASTRDMVSSPPVRTKVDPARAPALWVRA